MKIFAKKDKEYKKIDKKVIEHADKEAEKINKIKIEQENKVKEEKLYKDFLQAQFENWKNKKSK